MNRLFTLALISTWASSQATPDDIDRDTLQQLTKSRQEHRKTLDGRLCAAAFVQSGKAYTGGLAVLIFAFRQWFPALLAERTRAKRSGRHGLSVRHVLGQPKSPVIEMSLSKSCWL
jgi:hypothetical protein